MAEAGGIPFRRDVPIAFMRHEELVAYLAEAVDDRTIAVAYQSRNLFGIVEDGAAPTRVAAIFEE